MGAHYRHCSESFVFCSTRSVHDKIKIFVTAELFLVERERFEREKDTVYTTDRWRIVEQY